MAYLSREEKRKAYAKLVKLKRSHKDVCKWLATVEAGTPVDDIVEQAVDKFPEKERKKRLPVKERLQKQHDEAMKKQGKPSSQIKWPVRRQSS